MEMKRELRQRGGKRGKGRKERRGETWREVNEWLKILHQSSKTEMR